MAISAGGNENGETGNEGGIGGSERNRVAAAAPRRQRATKPWRWQIIVISEIGGGVEEMRPMKSVAAKTAA
jgi:hypothetical protein